MKGVVLHGGLGTRLRPLTFSGPKQLIPVANKPVSQYAVEDLVSSGVRDIAIVLGDVYPELVVSHYGDGSRFGARITYISQGRPLGIAHAVGLCRDFVGSDRFVVYLGDNILRDGIGRYVERFSSRDLDAMVLLKEVEDPRPFGVAKLDPSGRLAGFVEKPRDPPSRLALVGVYFLTPAVFDVIKDLKPSWRGELEITDALQLMLERGYRVGYEIVEGWWVDTGKKDDILAVNALILDERGRRDVRGSVAESRIEGRVEVGEGTRIVRSTVRGPSIIGRNCLIENSYIGPYTSIGDNCRIVDSSVEHSVILEGSTVIGVERMSDSLIGRNAKIVRQEGNRRALKLSVGDHSEVVI